MTNEILKYKDWHPWLERPFSPLLLSLFKNSVSSEYNRKIGVAQRDYPMLFQNQFWYQSPKMMQKYSQELGKYLQRKSFFEFTHGCTKFYRHSKTEIQQLALATGQINYKLERLIDIFSYSTTYIMLTHGFEWYYQRYPEELLTQIRPKKKVAAQRMQQALLRGDDLKRIQVQYGWLRCRDKFIRPFSIAELKKERAELQREKSKKLESYKVPSKYKKIAAELGELIWFRTYRTDVFYELWYLARPLLKQIARHYHVPFSNLPYYSLPDLLKQKPKKYSKIFSFYCYQNQSIIQAQPFVKIKVQPQAVITGQIAFPGRVIGRVKIIKTTNDLKKVKTGDILVTQMTFPSYIIAMRKAKAFVTDEGGITCHAAIVAREMHKPCIIGTKIATRLLHDGDLVEVDTQKNLVKKI